MKNGLVYLIHILGLILVFKVKAFGQTSYELQCKAQAKEIALQTYQTCVTENRQQQIDTLRKEYQQKLMELKEHYNQELKKAAGKETSVKPNEARPLDTEETTIKMKPAKKTSAAKMGKAEKPVKGIAKNLPRKQNNNGPALSTTVIHEETPVVPSYDDIEVEAAQADQSLNTEVD